MAGMIDLPSGVMDAYAFDTPPVIYRNMQQDVPLTGPLATKSNAITR